MRQRNIGIAITLSSVTLVAAGVTTAVMFPKMTNAAALPGRTTYVGSSNGPLQVVQNAATTANAAAIQGYVNNTLGGIGFIGTGTSKNAPSVRHLRHELRSQRRRDLRSQLLSRTRRRSDRRNSDDRRLRDRSER